MITLDINSEKFTTEYGENLIKLRIGDELGVTGFEDKKSLRESAVIIMHPRTIRNERYQFVFDEGENEQDIKYIVKRIL